MNLSWLTRPKPQSLALETEKLHARKPSPMAKKSRILRALQAAGDAGVPAGQLARISYRYSTRISDLRKAGYDIECVRHHNYRRFVLRGKR